MGDMADYLLDQGDYPDDFELREMERDQVKERNKNSRRVNYTKRKNQNKENQK